MHRGPLPGPLGLRARPGHARPAQLSLQTPVEPHRPAAAPAAGVPTHALVWFPEIEREDKMQTSEPLLTQVVAQISPFVYAKIHRKVEAEMGIRPPEPPKRKRPKGPN